MKRNQANQERGRDQALSGMLDVRRLARLALRAVLGLGLLLGAAAGPAYAAQGTLKNFDHTSTGFPLTGQHLSLIHI